MKNTFTLSALLLLLTVTPFKNLLAQSTEGRVVYAEQMKFDHDTSQMKGNMPPGMQMPKMPALKMELLFRGNESLWQSVPVENTNANTPPMHDGGMMMVMRNDKEEEKMYINRTDKKVVENRSIMDKLFLVNTDLRTLKWKITGEQDTVAGYTCMKAVLQNDTNIIIAWFTPQIQVPAGPKDYGQLPGLILKLDIRNGKHVYRASLVELKLLQPDAIVIPTKGKEVTDEEFKQLRRDKMKEMGFGDGHGSHDGGNMQVIIK